MALGNEREWRGRVAGQYWNRVLVLHGIFGQVYVISVDIVVKRARLETLFATAPHFFQNIAGYCAGRRICVCRECMKVFTALSGNF
jgi:hypothetical protein